MPLTILITIVLTVLAVVLAMNFATPQKKLERKIRHRYAIADPQYRREMSVLLGPAILPGNQVTNLQNGNQIFPAMLEAIASAQQTVTFETYIYWSGEVGRKFGAALSERARAGVEVNVTIDWVGSIKMDAALLDEMDRAGVLVHRYRPLRRRRRHAGARRGCAALAVPRPRSVQGPSNRLAPPHRVCVPPPGCPRRRRRAAETPSRTATKESQMGKNSRRRAH